MLNFDELEKGFTEQEALEEARRCLKCKAPLCVKGCPIENRIPETVRAIEEKNYRRAIDIINEPAGGTEPKRRDHGLPRE